ncbi:MAG: hypothetical protein IH591_12460, partial [Bacteroidales bacterium]|nr:hypothetical protein [Bacteroidales bacterium]
MEIKIFRRGEGADYSAFLEENNADLDIYYSLSFLEVESNQQGVGFEIFTASERGDLFVYPYFKLQISKPHEGWYDISSPFGYAGPWCNSPEFFAKAEKQLVEYLSERCVSEFVRYHFLYNQAEEQRFAVNCQNHFNRDIVVTNLTEGTIYDPARHMSSRNLKYYRSLMAGGFSFRFYSIPDYYELFTGMYHDTMRQAGAAADKFFPGSYFLALNEALGDKCRLAGVEKDGIIYSMVFFFNSGGILQYYLSGRDLRFTKVPSSVVMFAELA